MKREYKRSWIKGLSVVLRFLYFQTAFFVLFTRYAHAYIDPSAVTYMIQAVAAVAIAGGAALTVLRHKISALFRGKKQKTPHRRITLFEEPAPYDADFADGKGENACS
ncbi:MAG: hypothetical protein IJ600_09790 [Lachnospiraceae bacterium]|nr:hypothetical protein [Lachnospiraceae bacterium]